MKRKDLIRYFKQLGFEGPFSGKRHQIMIKGAVRVPIPNPHRGDIMNTAFATTALVAFSTSIEDVQAKPVLETRGPNGAAHIVKEVSSPARKSSMTQARRFPRIITRGPGGAAHID